MNQIFNCTELFCAAAAREPERLAIVHGEQRITFAELQKQVDDTAAYFLSKGLRKGDAVLVVVPMSIDLYRIVLALFRMGATAVFLDEWVSRKRLKACLDIVPCKALIAGGKVRLLAWFSAAMRRIPVHLGLKYRKTETAIFGETVMEDTALITFTTGTTGTPKAARRTHGFLKAQFEALTEVLQPSPEDIDMPALPIVLLLNLGIGCTSVIAPFRASNPETMDPGKIAAEIEANSVTRLVASPYFVKRIADFYRQSEKKPETVREVFTGGAAVFPKEAEEWNDLFTNQLVKIIFGSTEAEPISEISSNELVQFDVAEAGGLPVGKPYRGSAVKIIRITEAPIVCAFPEELEALEKPAGEIGEIIVSGKHVLREYINNEAAVRRNKIHIGDVCWHRTGDSGFLDASGMLFLTGRCSTLIPVENGIVSTFMIENKLQLLQEIKSGTALLINDLIVISVQLTEGSVLNDELRLKLKDLFPFSERTEVFVRLPRDPRHYSRIDYVKLEEMLRKRLSSGR